MTETRQFLAARAPRLRRGFRGVLEPLVGRFRRDRPGDAPLDLRGFGLHPLEARERAGRRRFVVDLPLVACRGHRWAAFPCAPGAGHPFLESARALLADGDLRWEESPLCRYYSHFQPRTVAEYLCVEPTHPALRAGPQAACAPWEPPPPPGVEARRRAELERENHSHGAALGAEHGFHHYGPVSPAKGELELARLSAILTRLRMEGFRLLPGPDGLCRARLLTVGNDWRAMLISGHHRIAALAALGHAAAPFWIPLAPVRREDADAWPLVRAGVLTRAQALEVFDRLFAGRQPAALDAAYWPTSPPSG